MAKYAVERESWEREKKRASQKCDSEANHTQKKRPMTFGPALSMGYVTHTIWAYRNILSMTWLWSEWTYYDACGRTVKAAHFLRFNIVLLLYRTSSRSNPQCLKVDNAAVRVWVNEAIAQYTIQTMTTTVYLVSREKQKLAILSYLWRSQISLLNAKRE